MQQEVAKNALRLGGFIVQFMKSLRGHSLPGGPYWIVATAAAARRSLTAHCEIESDCLPAGKSELKLMHADKL